MTIDTATVLSKILNHKRVEVERQRAKVPLDELRTRLAQAPPVRDFAAALRHPTRATLIAEVKKASPSRGVLIEHFDPVVLAQTYAEHGAAAISVLTDVRFFQGSLKYLEAIRNLNLEARNVRLGETTRVLAPSPKPHVPILRKDFLLDPYQVYEARAYGADALLLIVAALDDGMLAELLKLTHELGMQALVEVHDAEELARALAAGARIIGVNNRNLHTFEVTLATTEQVAARLPQHDRPLLVSESGISSAGDVARVRACGADAVLVGEALVTAGEIGAKVREIAGGL
ncbi:MAG: indole-3-glycerol phosphate synthase TrpC [Roseiflexaceae bacterium]|nr:indole-3-glycerol phosphate synthase TrpC [Roseiflexaceae bacterium]